MSIITNEAYATRSLRRHVLAGMTILGIGCGGFGAWAFGASLHGAVIASGQFVVASEVKKVQHPTGGVVSALFVKEGAAVNEGDVLFLLDETAIRASVQVLSRELFEYAVRSARLIAERDGKETFEARLPPGIVLTEGDQASIVNAERRLFLSRSGLRNGQRALLAARLEQVREEGTVSSSRSRTARSSAASSTRNSRTFAAFTATSWSSCRASRAKSASVQVSRAR